MGNKASIKEIPIAKAVRVTLNTNETKQDLIKRYKERNPEASVYNTLASLKGRLDELKTVLFDEDLSQILNTLSSTGYGYKDMATPLMTAAKYGNLEVVKYLLSS